MMKKSLIILFFIFLTIIPLEGCTKVFNSYEDKLYSEKTVLGNQTVTAKTSDILTRENAIKKAIELFDRGLNIKIDRTKFTENIKLINYNKAGNLQWQITWNNANSKTYYSCQLDSSSGEVLGISSYDNSILNKSNSIKLSTVSTEEILSIAQPLIKQLNIDSNNYKAGLGTKKTSSIYTDVLLYNKSSQKEEFIITVDTINKVVVNFGRFNIKSLQIEQEKNNYEDNSSSRR